MAGRFQDIPESSKDVDTLLRDTAAAPQRIDQLDPWDYIYQADDDTIRKRVWPLVRRYLQGGEPLLRARGLELTTNWLHGYDDTEATLFELADQHRPLYDAQVVEG